MYLVQVEDQCYQGNGNVSLLVLAQCESNGEVVHRLGDHADESVLELHFLLN